MVMKRSDDEGAEKAAKGEALNERLREVLSVLQEIRTCSEKVVIAIEEIDRRSMTGRARGLVIFPKVELFEVDGWR